MESGTIPGTKINLSAVRVDYCVKLNLALNAEQLQEKYHQKQNRATVEALKTIINLSFS